jgi:UPF0755 protein
MPLLKISQNLTLARADQKVTLIEGWRSEQIGELLVEAGFDLNLISWQETVRAGNLEGRLFPDTYYFPQKANQEEILAIIEKNFQKKVVTGLKEEIGQSKLTLEQILTLASIIEREVHEEEARQIVAGILLKRWQNHWPLQADATVQYAVASSRFVVQGSKSDWWPKSLTKKDLSINSPYNTYLSRRLPPGPICNPGLSSIKAVLNSQPSLYWFYISDKQGQMHYAKTDEEQARNIQKYLR